MTCHVPECDKKLFDTACMKTMVQITMNIPDEVCAKCAPGAPCFFKITVI
ncbi:hypothetical protein GXY_10259 [Novacetimonas hansenii ATCC 23769]|uniref:Uncharacterized protein n=1 Tax=Novacetimonas hansenii ATCC 23769 TaxID=714995 RepID=D5QFY2_NOVHA|nr:hypothetical protein GXY_10259 [Novacetimonas hansenii ATCC 23769]